MIKRFLFLIFKKIAVSFAGRGWGSIYFFDKLYRFALSLLRPEFVEWFGYKLYLDRSDSLNISAFGGYDQLLRKFLLDYLEKGMIVVDVGAHIGSFSLMMSSLVGSRGKVYAFEPDPNNFDILKKNVEVNKIKNIIIEKKAVSDLVGKVRFAISGNSLTHRISVKRHKQVGNKDFIYVDSVTLDNYLGDQIDKVSLVKIDVEGCELLVLKGAQQLLKTNRRIKLVMEFCPEHFKNFNYEARDLLDFLEGHGFLIYNIDERNKKIYPIKKHEIIANYLNGGITNILCIRK